MIKKKTENAKAKKFTVKGLASKPIAKQTVTKAALNLATGGVYGIVEEITTGVRDYRIARAVEEAVDRAVDGGLVSEETVRNTVVSAMMTKKELTSEPVKEEETEEA